MHLKNTRHFDSLPIKKFRLTFQIKTSNIHFGIKFLIIISIFGFNTDDEMALVDNGMVFSLMFFVVIVSFLV